jgi:hypothetical protein
MSGRADDGEPSREARPLQTAQVIRYAGGVDSYMKKRNW